MPRESFFANGQVTLRQASFLFQLRLPSPKQCDLPIEFDG
jgi:hypothetical protein